MHQTACASQFATNYCYHSSKMLQSYQDVNTKMLIPRIRLDMTLLISLLLTGFYVVEIHGNPAKIIRGISSIRAQQCRDGCIDEFAAKETLCEQITECLTCWDDCAKPSPPKINKSIRETWSLHTVSMLQQDSLVLVDVAWTPLSTPNQCLVTWEVSGGGLMGNLLTESFGVQLSLWPDTKYRVQVTCKNKMTGEMSRSLPLTIDTAEATVAVAATDQQQFQKQTSTIVPPLPFGVQFRENLDVDSVDSTSRTISAAPPTAEMRGDHQPKETDITEKVGSLNDVNVSSENNVNLLHEEEQSEEQTIQEHTNFVFDWRRRNNDVNVIEPPIKADLNLVTIAALSQVQKPLIFGVIAGTILLAIVLLIYICVTSHQRLSGDKIALITGDVHSSMTSLPPSILAAAATKSRITKASLASYKDVGMNTSANCKYAATCSRNALKV